MTSERPEGKPTARERVAGALSQTASLLDGAASRLRRSAWTLQRPRPRPDSETAQSPAGEAGFTIKDIIDDLL